MQIFFHQSFKLKKKYGLNIFLELFINKKLLCALLFSHNIFPVDDSNIFENCCNPINNLFPQGEKRTDQT